MIIGSINSEERIYNPFKKSQMYNDNLLMAFKSTNDLVNVIGRQMIKIWFWWPWSNVQVENWIKITKY